MKMVLKEVAWGIGMQAQYLSHAVYDGQVDGKVVVDYHNDESWVDTDSVKKYVQLKYDNGIIAKESFEEGMKFLNELE